MSSEHWSRAMRAIWLLNTIEVELSHLGTLRTLGDTLSNMSEQDRQLVEDELTRAHGSLAQAVAELQAGMSEIESLLRGRTADSSLQQPHHTSSSEVSERERSVV